MTDEKKRPLCIFYDYGLTAPIEFGAYCTLPEHPCKIPHTLEVCEVCMSYIPNEDKFEDFLIVHKDNLAKLPLEEALKVAWNRATIVERYTWRKYT
jgi:hypothetical protein